MLSYALLEPDKNLYKKISQVLLQPVKPLKQTLSFIF